MNWWLNIKWRSLAVVIIFQFENKQPTSVCNSRYIFNIVSKKKSERFCHRMKLPSERYITSGSGTQQLSVSCRRCPTDTNWYCNWLMTTNHSPPPLCAGGLLGASPRCPGAEVREGWGWRAGSQPGQVAVSSQRDKWPVVLTLPRTIWPCQSVSCAVHSAVEQKGSSIFFCVCQPPQPPTGPCYLPLPLSGTLFSNTFVTPQTFKPTKPSDNTPAFNVWLMSLLMSCPVSCFVQIYVIVLYLYLQDNYITVAPHLTRSTANTCKPQLYLFFVDKLSRKHSYCNCFIDFDVKIKQIN